MGTEYLIIAMLWCQLNADTKIEQRACAARVMACISQLKNFTTDDVVRECLTK